MKMYLNVLSVIRKDSYVKTSFNVARIVDKVLGSMECYPLYTEEFPDSLVAQNPKRFKNLNHVYTDFTERSDADFTATVDLNKASKFALQHARHVIRSRFRTVKGAILSQNFVNDIDILLPASKQEEQQPYTKYYGFSIRPQYARITDGLEFVIIYNGITRVLKKNIGEIAHLEDKMTRIIYKGQIYSLADSHAKDAPYKMDIENAFPILNDELEAAFGIPSIPPETSNKYIRVKKIIDHFRQKFILSGAFNDIFDFPNGGQFYSIPEEKVFRLPDEASDILVKGGEISTKDNKQYKFAGPYDINPEKLRVIIIHQSREGETFKEKVETILRHGIKDRDTDRYPKIPPMYQAIKKGIAGIDYISFSSLDNAVAEVSLKLSQIDYQQGYKYLGIYISPISHTDYGHSLYDIVYSRMKEEGLKHNVVIQGISHKSLSESNKQLSLYFTNIYAAILGKIGGIPWTIRPTNTDDMIIGIGAFYSQKKGKRYIASAFCFDGSGRMKEYDCIHVNDHSELVSKIYRAIDSFARNQGGALPKRIIIHCYKKIGRKEWMPIERMLQNDLGLTIPVVIITIGKNESRDIWGFDDSCSDLMPLSGTYTQIGPDTYLLYNSSKYGQTTWNSNGPGKNFLFPIKLRFDFKNSQDLNTPETIAELTQQVYQLSRMYWKTIDQQNLPITIIYPSLIAEFLPHFQGDGLPNPDFSTQTLWFL
jgi:hypothetical protein